MKVRSYQAILVSSIILAILFVGAILFSALTVVRHTQLVEDTNHTLENQAFLARLTADLDDYRTALFQNVDNLKYDKIVTVENRKKCEVARLAIDNHILYLQKITEDLDIKMALNDFSDVVQRLNLFQNSDTQSSNDARAEIRVHYKKLHQLMEQMTERNFKIYKSIQEQSHVLIKKGKAISVFIVVFGIVVALFLSISVFMALTQTVSRNYVEIIMQSIGNILMVFDENGKLSFINTKAKEVLNYNDELIGKAELSDFFNFSFNELVKGNSALEYETTCKTNANESIPVLVSVTVLYDDDGNPNGIIISAQDLRAFKTLQNRLVQSEKMASLGTIAAGVAHEINNPVSFIQSNLSTIKSYDESIKKIIFNYRHLEMLATEHSDPTFLGVLEQIRQIRKEEAIDYVLSDMHQAIVDSLEGTSRIRDIVQGLRSFSRADDSILEYVNLNDVLEGTLKLVWNELKYKCEVVKEFGELPSIRCFQRQISQVLMNLLINAVQAIEDKGRIVLKTEHQKDHIVITVTDNGKGISKENLSKIFDPFFTTKPVGTGTGLGLSISYGIVKKHGGSIEVQSELGKGTVFRLLFPVKGVENV